MGQALAIASLASTVIGTGLAVSGQRAQAKAQSNEAKFRAAVARNNDIVSRREADLSRARGEQDARRQEERTRQLIGTQRATLAANGVVVDQGSAADITADTAEIGALDAITIRRNAEREALLRESQGAEFASESALRERESSSTLRAGRTESFGTVLSGIGSVSSKWHAFKEQGTFG